MLMSQTARSVAQADTVQPTAPKMVNIGILLSECYCKYDIPSMHDVNWKKGFGNVAWILNSALLIWNTISKI